MRKNRSKYASKNYPNLYRYPDSPFWVFRKFSHEKKDEFKQSTGEAKNEAKAYRIGLDAYNEWLGHSGAGSKTITIRDLGLQILESKESKKANTKRTVRNQIKNHVIPAFGYLQPNQMNSLRWDRYDAQERVRKRISKKGKELPPRTKLFNTRKALMEILNRAEELGYIRRVPELKNHDPAPEPPRYLERKQIRMILKNMVPGNVKKVEGRELELFERVASTKLLAFIMWKQGARPNEVLQYRFSMINWNEGPHGSIHIPAIITKTGRPRTIPLNSRVSRVLKWVQQRVTSDLIFPSIKDPEKAQAAYDTAWNSACRRAGVEATIYNLRDTYITDALNRGISSSFIAKYVDNSAAMIDKRYAVAEKSIMERLAG
ncbi:MAG: hypothetical protein A2428_03260 [Bdellovibrionales bacterium RIFOXYC1_FULL_54_43]|nr:MAG: hypothetical protein A2428_03260 [Bdellovibrionales bacterium RIFOXYC1_FULL_54_43]OFZ82699.1 MAG: hypothetical protein A2603_02695 [Bdellovibrionales bacterium RIFOXYD1_FULL_55_31]